MPAQLTFPQKEKKKNHFFKQSIYSTGKCLSIFIPQFQLLNTYSLQSYNKFNEKKAIISDNEKSLMK